MKEGAKETESAKILDETNSKETGWLEADASAATRRLLVRPATNSAAPNS